MIHLHDNRCLGITLWKSSVKHIELWICAPFYSIKPHVHFQEDATIMYLFGNASLHRIRGEIEKSIELMWPWDLCRRFSVKATDVHWFIGSWLPLIFINAATFHSGYKTKSASKDIQYL